MLKALEMLKITIAGPDSEMEKSINTLYKMGAVHIVDHKKGEIDIGIPLENAARLSDILIKIRAILSLLGIEGTQKDESSAKKIKEISRKINLNRLEKEIINIELMVNDAIKGLKIREDEIRSRKELLKKLELLANLNMNVEAYSSYNTLAGFVGQLSSIDKFSEELGSITKRHLLRKHELNKSYVIALFVDKLKEKEVQALLAKHGFASFDMSSLNGIKGDIHKNCQKAKAKLDLLEREKASKERLLEKLKKENIAALLLHESILKEEIEKAEAPLRFAKTKSSFIMNGWLPAKKAEKCVKELEASTKKKLFIQVNDAEEHDAVPVKLNNPAAAKPFEFLMELYTLPKYQEIDPTFFVFLTFPILFGFMLGDIGYGIVCAALFYLLKRSMPAGKQLFDILLLSSISTIFFGLLFGEFFGEEIIFGYELPHLLSRAHQINLLMYLAVAVGVIHINSGIIIGFFNALKAHGLKKAVFEKLSWIFLQAGVALIALSALKYIPLPVYFGIGVALLSVIALYLGEGVNGLVELPGIFSNILSYARLMAIGLASVELAVVINELSKKLFEGGAFGMFAGITLLVVGHVVNIGIGILGAFLHSLRLHYVEFFTKFFKGGATRYNPFGLKTVE